jgi:hypothetical protein
LSSSASLLSRQPRGPLRPPHGACLISCAQPAHCRRNEAGKNRVGICPAATQALVRGPPRGARPAERGCARNEGSMKKIFASAFWGGLVVAGLSWFAALVGMEQVGAFFVQVGAVLNRLPFFGRTIRRTQVASPPSYLDAFPVMTADCRGGEGDGGRDPRVGVAPAGAGAARRFVWASSPTLLGARAAGVHPDNSVLQNFFLTPASRRSNVNEWIDSRSGSGEPKECQGGGSGRPRRAVAPSPRRRVFLVEKRPPGRSSRWPNSLVGGRSLRAPRAAMLGSSSAMRARRPKSASFFPQPLEFP